jgi:signal transduction histidine kinase
VTTRLLLSYVTLAVFVLAILEIPLGVAFARNEQTQLSSSVERDATVLAGVAEDALERGVPTDLAAVADRYEERTGGRVVIVDVQGVSVADSDPPAPGRRDFSSRTEIRTALDGRVATGTRYSDTLGLRLLYVAVPVASGGVVHGAVRITYPTIELDRRVTRNWLLLGAVAAVVLAAATLASFLIARSVSRPLRRLRQRAADLADGQLSTRADTTAGPPEVRAVAATFNTMAARLEALLASQRAFVADASHQLRTPLTALRLRLENLETDVSGDAAAELAAAIDEVERLARLVDGLLVLARTDGHAVEPIAVDVDGVMRDRAATWRPVMADRDVELRLASERVPDVLAATGAVEQVLDNLIANAAEVAPAGSVIILQAQQVEGAVELHVIDEGPGMSVDQREHAFDRFWRAASADHDGFGLGLAIVHRLVTAAGGRVELRPADGGGLDAVVVLSAAPSSSLGAHHAVPVQHPPPKA